MFFSCTTCGTRLQLPDEQVVNRILKVRCTACSAVMTVRDGTTGQHQRPTESAWFVAVAGQQKGPIALSELRSLVAEGRVDQRSYAWTAGMGQWTRAGEIAALASLFQVAAPEPPPLPPPPRSNIGRTTVVAMRALGAAPEAGEDKAVVTHIPSAPGAESAVSAAGSPSGLLATTEVDALKEELHRAAEAAEAEARAKIAAEEAAARAKAEAERAEAERQAKVAAEKLEAERRQRQLEAEQRAAAIEAERIAKVAAAAVEAERQAKLAAEKAEAERQAKLAADQAEAERQAKLAADQAEAERQAAARAALPDPFAPDPLPPVPDPFAVVSPPAPDPFAPDVSPSAPDPFAPAPPLAEPPATKNDAWGAEVQDEIRAFHQDLAFESSVRPKKKRWLWVAVGVLAAGAVIAILLRSPPPAERIAADVAPTKKPYDTELRREIPTQAIHTETAPVAPAAPATPEEVVAKPEDPNAPKPTDPKPIGKTREKASLVVPGVDPATRKLTPEQFKALTEDDSGKSETRIEFDPGAEARKAAEEAVEKKSDALAGEVAEAFGKKRAQFAKCSDSAQERVKVVFTVTPTGKTTNAHIEGTKNVDKTNCIRAILGRSVFPAGDQAATYSQTLVL